MKLNTKSIDVHSEGLQYGYGAFETILVKDGVLVDFDAHYDRLFSAMIYLKMDFEITRENLCSDAKLYLGSQTMDFGVLKISCHLTKNITEVVFSVRKFPYTKEHYKKGYRVCLSKLKRHSENPIYQIKSNNFINNFLESKEIKSNGFDEAIHLNQNSHITEGIYSNIFFVKDGVLYTSDVKAGLLPGIQRQKVIDISKKIGIPINIGYYNIEDIKNSDELFLTNSLIGVMKVASFEDTFEDSYYDTGKYTVMDRLKKEML